MSEPKVSELLLAFVVQIPHRQILTPNQKPNTLPH